MTRLSRRHLILSSAAATSLTTLGGRAITGHAEDSAPTVTVGTKNFTEVIILGEMMSQLLEDAGYPVDKQFNLGGTVVVHEGATAGDIDVYQEYTGTGLLTILGHDISDVTESNDNDPATPAETDVENPVAKRTYDIVSKEYPEQFGLEWLEPIGFNNTYVLAVTPEIAETYDLETCSDLQGVAQDLVFGCSQEFMARPDGLPNLQKTYDVDFKDEMGFEPSLVYSAIEQGQVDIIAGAATEGHIERLGLVKLVDDLGYFPPYYAAPVVRQDLLAEAPDIRDVLNQLAGRIDDQTMGSLNLESDQDGRNPGDIARDFLAREGLIEG